MFSGEEPSLKLIRTQVFSVKLQMADNEPVVDVIEEGASSSSDSLILRPRKRSRKSYLQIVDLREIFPEATPTTLCALAEAYDNRPSRILQIVPTITSQQLADYGLLVKRSSSNEAYLDEIDSSKLLEAMKQTADNSWCCNREYEP